MDKKLLLIDGNSIINRAFYATANVKLQTPSGVYTNAVLGFLNIMFKLIEEEKPDYLGVSFDRKEKTKRKQMYDGYKSGRSKMPEELAMQLPILKLVLDAMDIPMFEQAGIEADDILGTIAKRETLNDPNLQVAILTGDKDYFQLIDEQIYIRYPQISKGSVDYVIYDTQKVAEKYDGLKPKDLIQLKAIMGDPSDNIPGVKGIGQKGATNLILENKTVANVYAKLEDGTLKATKSVLEKLKNEKEMAFLSLELGTIDTNVDVDIDMQKLAYTTWKNIFSYSILKMLSFESIIKRQKLQEFAYEKDDPKVQKELAKKEEKWNEVILSNTNEEIEFDNMQNVELEKEGKDQDQDRDKDKEQEKDKNNVGKTDEDSNDDKTSSGKYYECEFWNEKENEIRNSFFANKKMMEDPSWKDFTNIISKTNIDKVLESTKKYSYNETKKMLEEKSSSLGISPVEYLKQMLSKEKNIFATNIQNHVYEIDKESGNALDENSNIYKYFFEGSVFYEDLNYKIYTENIAKTRSCLLNIYLPVNDCIISLDPKNIVYVFDACRENDIDLVYHNFKDVFVEYLDQYKWNLEEQEKLSQAMRLNMAYEDFGKLLADTKIMGYVYDSSYTDYSIQRLLRDNLQIFLDSPSINISNIQKELFYELAKRQRALLKKVQSRFGKLGIEKGQFDSFKEVLMKIFDVQMPDLIDFATEGPSDYETLVSLTDTFESFEQIPTETIDILCEKFKVKKEKKNALVEICTLQKEEEQYMQKIYSDLFDTKIDLGYYVYVLYTFFAKLLPMRNLLELYTQIEHQSIYTLGIMQYNGIYLNKEKLEKLGAEIQKDLEQIQQKLNALAKTEINPASRQQVSKLLFEDLGLTESKKIKTGLSTKSDELLKIVDQHPIVQDILDYRELFKIQSTYIYSLIRNINCRTNRIHSTFNQVGTTTGRISSTSPNMQNIPTRKDIGAKVRDCFEPTNTDVFIDSDYSQIELRVLADLSCDKNMMDAFLHDEDIHTTTASTILDIPKDQVTKAQRSAAKAVNFGIIYGISDFGLSQNANIPIHEAKEYIKKYKSKYKAVTDFMADAVKFTKKHKFTLTLQNRRRYIQEINSTNYNVKEAGKRMAMNAPIQGTAADIMKKAIIDIQKSLQESKCDSIIVLQVHDEIIIECKQDEIVKVKEIIKKNMENAVKLKIPLKIEMQEGKTWDEAK